MTQHLNADGAVGLLEYHPHGFFEHTGNLWRAQRPRRVAHRADVPSGRS